MTRRLTWYQVPLEFYNFTRALLVQLVQITGRIYPTGITLLYHSLHGATIISGPRHTILTGLGAPYRCTRNLA